MQTSFHSDELDFYRAPDVSGQSPNVRLYSASEESLEALKARTTPIDNTNPYTSLHASCANAFIATAISLEHRYDEMQLKLPADSSAVAALSPNVAPQWVEVGQTTASVSDSQTLMPQAAVDNQLRAELSEFVFSESLAPFWIAQDNQPIFNWDVASLPTQFSIESHPAPISATPAMIELASDVAIEQDYQIESDHVVFSGNAPVGSTLHFYIDDVLVGSTETDDGGQWQFDHPFSLPAAQHTFSAVTLDQQGAINSKASLYFIVEPTLSEIILPAEESALELFDKGLIELIMQQRNVPEPILTLELNDEMWADWETLDGITLTEPLHPNIFIEMENDSPIWH